jgi:hypothetical protein
VRILIKQIKATFLITAIAVVLMIGITQQSKAAYYDNYYSYYQSYINSYNLTGNAYYYYTGYAFYYYYLSGLYGDSYAFQYDPFGNYSDRHVNPTYYSSFTYHDNYYNYYASIGDAYYRVYNSVTGR